MPLGIGVEQVARLRDRRLVADAGHHVLQRAPLGRVVMHIVGGENAQPVPARQRIQRVDARAVIAAVEMAHRDVAQAGQGPHERRQPGGEGGDIGLRHGDQLHAFRMGGQVVQRQVAGPFLLPAAIRVLHLAPGQQGAEPAIRGAVTRIGEEGLTADQVQPAADHRADMRLQRGTVQPHDPRHRVEIRDTQRVVPLRPGGAGEVHRVRRAVQEGKAGGHAKLDERRAGVGGEAVALQPAAGVLVIVLRHYANIPCTNQRGGPPRPSPCSPSR